MKSNHLSKHDRFKKLAFITVAYGFALMTAVACGENFKSKSLTPKAQAPAATNTTRITFLPNPVTNKMKLTSDPGENNPGTWANLTFLDGSKQVDGLMPFLSYSGEEGNDSMTIEEFTYSITAKCGTANCSEIAVLIGRFNKKTYENEQSAMYFKVNGTTFTTGAQENGTYYQELDDAYRAMKAKSP